MNKGIAGLELNSSIKQRGVKKVIGTVLYFLLKALNVSMNQLQVLRVNYFREKIRMLVSDCKNIFKKYFKISLNFYVSES